MVTVDQMIKQLQSTGYYWSIGVNQMGITCRIFSMTEKNARHCIIEAGTTIEDAAQKALSRFNSEKHNWRIKHAKQLTTS